MSLGKGILLGGVVVVVFAVSIPVLLWYLDAQEQEAAYQALIQESFRLLQNPSDHNLDEAVKKVLLARDIEPQGERTFLLLGRAYFLKNLYKESIEELRSGLNQVEDIYMMPEFQYHLGLAYSSLYYDLKQQDAWNKALDSFSEASTQGPHQADAFFGIGTLYFQRYSENPTPLLKEKVIINFQRFIDLESKMLGYEAAEPGSRCSYCAKAFEKKSEDENIRRLMDELTK